jgi:hypothetical protein
LQALPPDQQALAVLQQQPVILDLVLALIGRSELKPAAISTATADARDLPEELRLVSVGTVGCSSLCPDDVSCVCFLYSILHLSDTVTHQLSGL